MLFLVAAGFLGVYFAYHNNERPGAIVVLAVIVIAVHVFYLATYMFSSLKDEWERTSHLWLNTSQPGWMLLSAKLASGIINLLVLFGVTCFFTLWITRVELNNLAQLDFLNIDLVWAMINQYGWFIAVLVILGSIYTGLWAMMISVGMAASKSIISKGRFFVGLAIFLIPTWGMGFLQGTTVYDRLVRWGAIYLPQTPIAEFGHMHFHSFYTGEILFYAIIMAALLFISGWLLDHKVEV
ncbi:hypothetical protein SAMN05660649_01270 [Desulfotomaculum arcticum]|uniref:ABC-2 family transporter protein n=1 Tax=Desulfotruncus arcticus DSM 17038 TaxID=1121424 RepID=A0A1I2QQA8_9FIRM|nr:hypothetical protein [Desulfotruncus arcticus]SFG28447.1 hypothetical protein SAMN05660649_01270 [Desulfotomaculum arcticum] [Desulfotruncus arcticus DSM 17038]